MMSSRSHLVLISFMMLHATSFAQQTDSLIFAEGNIINAATKEPIKARIVYQSLPYGNRMGSFHNNFFSFPMFDNEKYSITVEADGFIPAKYLLDPAEANEFKRVIQDIELSAGAPEHHHTAGHVMRLNNLIFQLGRSKISPESFSELELVEKMMKENMKMVIQLEGHTDYLGSARDNLKLSQERVEAVKKHLVAKGIAKSRIKTKAFGGTMPLSRENTPEAHALNRRVELRILEN